MHEHIHDEILSYMCNVHGNQGNSLEKGDAVTGGKDEVSTVTLLENKTLVLFLANLNPEMTYAGNFSGIMK